MLILDIVIVDCFVFALLFNMLQRNVECEKEMDIIMVFHTLDFHNEYNL